MIEIYTKPDCTFCVQAKELLISRGIAYREFVVGKDVSRSWILEHFPQMRTVPIVTVGKELIGGYESLVEAVSENENLGKVLLAG